MAPDEADKRYMIVLDDRVFYYGYLGRRMKTRKLGSATLYIAPRGDFLLRGADGVWSAHDIAVVRPFEAHQIVADCGMIISVLIEPERLGEGELAALETALLEPGFRAGSMSRLRAAADRLAEAACADMTASEFDRIVFGRDLRERRMDARIEAAIDALEEDRLESPSLAVDLARNIGLSSSRFLHLFKEQTGVSFRNYRMWRRARSFLVHANHSYSLTDVALSLGYPDSSHFSHSIRKTFGLQPRSIRIGSQNLRVDASPRMAASLYA